MRTSSSDLRASLAGAAAVELYPGVELPHPQPAAALGTPAGRGGEAGHGEGVSGGGALSPGSALTLTHKLLGCVLADTAKALPKEWGYQLSQVVCSPWRRRINENYGMFVSS